MTPSNPDDARYTVTELADLAGVTPRTVRYYLSQGLLPTVGVTGPGAKYDDTHLDRLRLIRRLQREHLPLAEIRRRLEELDDSDVATLVDAAPAAPVDTALDYLRRIGAAAGPPPRPTETHAPVLARLSLTHPGLALASAPPTGPHMGGSVHAAETPAPYQSTRSQWERIDLAPDVELHVRRPLARSTAKRVDRLIEIARDLLGEERP